MLGSIVVAPRACEGSAAAASSAAGGNTSAIAELLAVAQLLAADGGRPEARVRPRRGPATMWPSAPFHPIKKTPI